MKKINSVFKVAIIGWIACVVLTAIVLLTFHIFGIYENGSDTVVETTELENNATVEAVISGTQVDVRMTDGTVRRVVLDGIAAPSENADQAISAREYLERWLPQGSEVQVTFLSATPDGFGMYTGTIESGNTRVQELMVENGYAIPTTNDDEILITAAMQAYQEGLGLWASGEFGIRIDR